MARRVIPTDATTVRRTIADAVLRHEHIEPALGTVRLFPHQLDAVARLRSALETFGGALLADAVGVGKTFVALAVARDYHTVLVIGPAVLRSHWTESAARAHVAIAYCSVESLSRRHPNLAQAELVIVDEAHRVRSARAQCHARLSDLTATSDVLLLTATPVHNRGHDLSALLALFFGERAQRLSARDLAASIVRREHAQIQLQARMPALRACERIVIPSQPQVLRAILSLPPAFTLRGGGDSRSLISRSLAHQYASSDAALIRAVRRRISAGYSIVQALETGLMPSRADLRAWSVSEEGAQLCFAELIVDCTPAVTVSAQALVRTHVAALEQLLQLAGDLADADSIRQRVLRDIRVRHPTARIVTFSQYAATVDAMYRALRNDARVAAISSRGARIASGKASRESVIRMLRSPEHERESISLLLTTDLLSEGINLPEASVVVHLDVPWTAARLEQRIGRCRRLGGPHDQIDVYALIPSPDLERVLRGEEIIAQKSTLATRLIGTPAIDSVHIERATLSAPARAEAIRSILRTWRSSCRPPATHLRNSTYVAAVTADFSGFVAAVSDRSGIRLICSREPTRGSHHISDDPAAVHEALSKADGKPSQLSRSSYASARRAIGRWFNDQEVTRLLGGIEYARRDFAHTAVARVERGVTAAPPHERTAQIDRSSRLRRRLGRRLSRGLERAIKSLDVTLSDDRAFTRELDRLLPSINAQSAPPSANRARVIAVLLIRDARN
jgi:superfamily II DNA or RNA helicase